MKLLATAIIFFSSSFSVFRLCCRLLLFSLFLLCNSICSIIFDFFDLCVNLTGHIKECLSDELSHGYSLHNFLSVAGNLCETLFVEVLNYFADFLNRRSFFCRHQFNKVTSLHYIDIGRKNLGD